jgi:hypothetical protein
MSNAEYEAKVMRWIYKFLPFVGAFMLFSQLLGPLVNLVRYSTGEKVQAQFVSKVRVRDIEHEFAGYRPDRMCV